jgi:hypothetical protein
MDHGWAKPDAAELMNWDQLTGEWVWRGTVDSGGRTVMVEVARNGVRGGP